MSKNNPNWVKAAEYYNLQPGWVLHHKDPSWVTEDPDRYNEWRIEDVVPMTIGDHVALHNKLRVWSDETRKKISENHRDVSGENCPFYGVDHSGENNPMYGKHHTEETREKMSKNHCDVSGNKNPMYGRKHSEATKEKIRAARARRKLEKEGLSI